MFVESYGQMAVQGTSFSPAIDRSSNAGTRQLQADGFSSRSGWLTSSTFGGGSWLAHATLQSGVWVNSPGRYSSLIASKRLTLPAAFRRAGWRTVADVPSTHGSWPEGNSFYRYEKICDRDNLGYRGPKFGFSADARPVHAPGAAEARAGEARTARRSSPRSTSTSSHEPWTRIPPLVSWNRLGNGSIFNRLPIDRTGLTDTQQGYAQSIQYALRALYSFIERYGNKNTVLIVLGDHQPSRVISGKPGHEVPITIIAHDPKVIDRLSSWGWTNGMLPSLDGAGLADERLPEPLPQRVRPLDPAARNAVPKNNSVQERSTSSSSHGCANRLPRTARDPLVDGAEGPRQRDSELRQPPRRVVRSLEIQHGPASAAGQGRGAVGDDVSAAGHLRQGVGGQDRVDLGREVERGRVGLHEADVAPAVGLDPLLGLGEHRVGQVDADDPALGTDRLLEQREVQTGAAGDVDDAVTRAKPECSYGPEALGPLRVAGHGVEPGGDVVVLRLLAVRLDQALVRAVDLAQVCASQRTRPRP